MTRGRKPFFPGEPMRRHPITVDEMTLRKLKVLGEGNVSAGVRVAAEIAYRTYQRDEATLKIGTSSDQRDAR